jgi:hypothetical protein
MNLYQFKCKQDDELSDLIGGRLGAAEECCVSRGAGLAEEFNEEDVK